MELRPLGFGEIFDRAVTLYIRNFVPFVALVLVLIVPLAIVQYFYNRAAQPSFDYMIRVFSHPGTPPPEHMQTVFNSPSGIVTVGLLLTFGTLLWPFALNAVAVGVARLYRNRAVDFRSCYSIVLERWLPILGLIVVEFLMLVGGYILLAFLIVAVVFLLTILAVASKLLSFWVGFIVGLGAGLAAFVALIPLFVALTFAMYAIVIEDCPIGESLSRGFRRVFNRSEFWRAFLFAIAAFATVACGTFIFNIVSIAALFFHQPMLQTVIDALGRAAVAPFGVVLMAIYYFDVRIRREGYDLETSLERLTAQAPA